MMMMVVWYSYIYAMQENKKLMYPNPIARQHTIYLPLHVKRQSAQTLPFTSSMTMPTTLQSVRPVPCYKKQCPHSSIFAPIH